MQKWLDLFFNWFDDKPWKENPESAWTCNLDMEFKTFPSKWFKKSALMETKLFGSIFLKQDSENANGIVKGFKLPIWEEENPEHADEFNSLIWFSWKPEHAPGGICEI